MTARSMKLGLAAFVVLSGAAVVNMVMLQPHGGRLGVARPLAAKLPDPPPRRVDERQAGDERETPSRALPPRPGVESSSGGALNPSAKDVTRAIQRELKDRGYDTGTADGQPGLMTRAAIMAFEHDRDLPLTAEPTPQLLKAILLGGPPAATRSRAGQEQSVQATQVVRTVQQSLVTLGYVPGKVDGRLGDDTVRAIREFEVDQGMPETGRVSGQLVARLSRLAGQGRLTSGR